MMPVVEHTVIEGKPAGDCNPVKVLLRLVSDAQVYRGGDGRLYARVPVGDHHDFYELGSSGFRDWLIDAYFLEREVPPPSSSLSRVIAVLEARARLKGTVRPVYVRVALEDTDVSPAYFLDLSDRSGRVIEIRDSGWTIVDRPSVEFRRPSGQLPLPLPRTDRSTCSSLTSTSMNAIFSYSSPGSPRRCARWNARVLDALRGTFGSRLAHGVVGVNTCGELGGAGSRTGQAS